MRADASYGSGVLCYRWVTPFVYLVCGEGQVGAAHDGGNVQEGASQHSAGQQRTCGRISQQSANDYAACVWEYY